MTEYTTSSQALRDYLSSKERTRHWVHNRIPASNEFYSPNIAPSILNDPDYVPAPPSDAGSTHSVPPKMVLRYNDGRADEPIYHGDANAAPLKRGGSKLRPHDSLRSQTLPTHRPRSGSQGAPRGPEEIRILPSHAVDAPRSAAPSQARSKSLPRNVHSHMQDPLIQHPLPPPSHHHSISAGGVGLPGPLPLPRAGPLVSFAPPPPQPWPNHGGSLGRRHAPPPIVYAPSHRSRPHYAPPVMYTHPPKMGPNGMIYSHSAPVPTSHHIPTPYPSAPSHMSSVDEGRASGSRNLHRHDRSRSHAGPERPSSPASSTSSFSSNDSGSTYYVMPTGRQKVHVIHTPDTTASLHTASSASHSPTSPNSLKKQPLFQRLLGFAEKRVRLFSSSGGDSPRGSLRGGRRLQRRHSTGGSASRRSRSAPPGE
ncbi:hypothetical protein R3P38DRAFT_2904934 [Favolaschia claudopus]|uniref:Uncharacterized protein n=1 Tax=Favolaschia claudopus TaxID=2862362 RepID=A0AAW0CK40_9AGAR